MRIKYIFTRAHLYYIYQFQLLNKYKTILYIKQEDLHFTVFVL